MPLSIGDEDEMEKVINGILSAILPLFFIGFHLCALLIIPKWKERAIGFGIDIPSWQMKLILASDLVVNYWFITIPISIGICALSTSWFWSSDE